MRYWFCFRSSPKARRELNPAPQRAGFFTSALQIPIPPPPLCSCDFLKRSACLEFVGIDLHQLLTVAADPAPVAHQAHGPEQIPLDHEAVEAPDVLLRVDPVQHDMVLDGGAGVVMSGWRPFGNVIVDDVSA